MLRKKKKKTCNPMITFSKYIIILIFLVGVGSYSHQWQSQKFIFGGPYIIFFFFGMKCKIVIYNTS